VGISFEVRLHPGYVAFACSETYTLESSLHVHGQALAIAGRENR